MMPSASGSLDPGGIDVEAVDSIDGPRLRPPPSADDRSAADGRPGPGYRVRVAALAAERDLIAAERERLDERVQSLTAEVESLEAEVAALEAEVKALEAALESEERQRQQVIDNYESIVAARRAADRSSETDAAVSARSDGWRPLAAIASRIGRVTTWLRTGRK